MSEDSAQTVDVDRAKKAGRTIEDALAHAENCRLVPEYELVTEDEGLTNGDVVALADEVKHLRAFILKIPFPLMGFPAIDDRMPVHLL